MADNDKKLYRSSSDMMLAGVCGGLGEYFGIDGTVMRVIFVILTVLMGGLGGVVVYVILWLIMPEAPGAADSAAPAIADEDAPASEPQEPIDAKAPAEEGDAEAASDDAEPEQG